MKKKVVALKFMSYKNKVYKEGDVFVMDYISYVLYSKRGQVRLADDDDINGQE